MPETVLLALVYSKVKGYNIGALFKQKGIYYVLIMEAVYVCLQATLFMGNYEVVQYANFLKSIYLCTYLGLIFRHELYKEALLGSGAMVLGGACNQIAIMANHGSMPVFPSLSYWTGYVKPEAFELAHEATKDFHILGGSDTRVKFLTDFIDIGYSVLSIGDVLIRVFVFLVIYSAIKRINRLEQHS